MAQMATAFGAMDLGPGNEQAAVLGCPGRACQRLEKTWPAGAAFERRVRGEQRLPAAGTGEDPRAFLGIQRAATGAFRPMLAYDLKLPGCQALSPFFIGMGNGKLFRRDILPPNRRFMNRASFASACSTYPEIRGEETGRQAKYALYIFQLPAPYRLGFQRNRESEIRFAAAYRRWPACG